MFYLIALLIAIFVVILLSLIIVYNKLLLQIENNKKWIINLSLRLAKDSRERRENNGENSEKE